MTQQEWDKKAIDRGGSILQSWVWGEFQKSLGFKVERFSGDDWLAQIIEHDLITSKKYWYSPRGPVGNAKAASEFLKKEADKNHAVVFLRLEPQEPIELPPSPKEIQPKENWVVGLEGSEQELLVSMKPKHRYNLNLAAKKGVTVREAGKNDFLEIWRLFMETASRGKFRLHPQNYYLQMFETLSPNYLRAYVAEYQGKILCCAFVSFFGHTATYLHGGSSDKEKQVMAPFLMHWEIMKAVKQLGYYNYDMGGISSDPNHSWAGITRFKKGFGGFEVRYPGTFDQILSPLWYNVYKNLRSFRKILHI
ncbi:MAG TPA: peptidoglycan bridge formation glycyltransferase FemA/FemB family protein [Candidatus Binatia bacterium]|nr:peptidoglycan bridge formation glycyltransferase FemA/FemB family protein [Candidatus Binatia bacterium]